MSLGAAQAEETRERRIPEESLKSVPRMEPSLKPGHERPAAYLNGTSLTVLAPIYEHAAGNISYVRFYNQKSATSTISVQIVGTPTGRVYGTASVTVPAKASLQLAYTQILQRAGVTPGAYIGNDGGFSFYMSAGSNSSQSYQHVIHNADNGFFENMSVCQWDETGIEGLLDASLINVHTTSPYMDEYPSLISFHHYGNTSARYRVRVYRATDGVLMENYTFTMRPKETFIEDAAWYQDTWNPLDVDSHMNIVFSRDDGGSFEGIPGHYIVNARLGAAINMSQFCHIGYTPVK
jgi:hypothetical protein